ncbi:MAG: 2-keto-4-pentenoate hydratase [Hyphomicrobiaceae bacterium]
MGATRSQQFEQLAMLLADARRTATQIRTLDPDLEPATPAAAYAVSARVAEHLGWAPLGWKIAGTTPEMQRRLRLSHPIYGRTFARFATPAPARFERAQLLDPLIECEFFFRLGTALPPRAEPYVDHEVAAAVATCQAGVEVAECRFPLDRLPSVPAILADGAASGRYVMGPEIADWRSRDLSAMAVTLSVNGEVRRRGSGRDVMGDPLKPLVWLANERSAWGDGLAAGALISTGTATGMLLAQAGDRMQARFGDLAVIELAFT